MSLNRWISQVSIPMWTSVWMLSGPVNAGGGHPHSEAPTASVSIGPHRLPDGAVFLPKPAQRQMDVRTQPVVMGDLAQAVELAGKVVMDPNAGGKVQAVLAGRDDVSVLDAPALLGVPDAERGDFVQLWPHRHGTDAMFCALLRLNDEPRGRRR